MSELEWLDHIKVYNIENEKIIWKVIKNIQVNDHIIPCNFVSDLGSIPSCVWWFPNLQPWSRAALYYLLHDWQYSIELGEGSGNDSLYESIVSPLRYKADFELYLNCRKIFRLSLSRIIYHSVRMGGFLSWYQNTPQSVKKIKNLLNTF